LDLHQRDATGAVELDDAHPVRIRCQDSARGGLWCDTRIVDLQGIACRNEATLFVVAARRSQVMSAHDAYPELAFEIDAEVLGDLQVLGRHRSTVSNIRVVAHRRLTDHPGGTAMVVSADVTMAGPTTRCCRSMADPDRTRQVVGPSPQSTF